MAWTVIAWGKAVDSELDELPPDLLARLARYRRLIEVQGPDALPMPHARYLGDGLWELRLSGKDRTARVIYVTVRGRRVVLLRALVKKTQKTPARELELARRRARMLMT
jgi:phage-related protein